MERILIVDDDLTFALMLRTWLTKKGFEVETAGTVAAARTALAAADYALVLSDMRLPDEDGVALLQWISGRPKEVPVIVMTSYAEIQNAVRCMKLGARDYVAKPVNPDELLKKIREALAPAAPKTKSAAQAPAPKTAGQEERLNYIEGRSDAARQLYQYVHLVAPTNMSVLIGGASGTGKEHVAQLIHRRSKRAGKPFVAVDCGAIARELAASEFFGHVKGSFTGAVSDKTGAFEAASGGTLFLDEVGNLTYETQVQLLRALQERRIRPVGSNREIPVDIRLVAATNEDLEAAIARGTFRADLFHRINEFTLRMPELRQMQGDIPLFADFFLDEANRQLDKHIVGFDPAASAALMRYAWPGNLRQLKNAVMSATLLCTGEYISCRDLPAEIVGGPIAPGMPHASGLSGFPHASALSALPGMPGASALSALSGNAPAPLVPPDARTAASAHAPGSPASTIPPAPYSEPACFPAPTALTSYPAAAPPAVPLRNPAGEEEQIRRALALTGGNKSQAAKLLGIDRKTLYNKLRLYGIA